MRKLATALCSPPVLADIVKIETDTSIHAIFSSTFETGGRCPVKGSSTRNDRAPMYSKNTLAWG